MNNKLILIDGGGHGKSIINGTESAGYGIVNEIDNLANSQWIADRLVNLPSNVKI